MNFCSKNSEKANNIESNEQKGASMVEYALLVALIALIALAAVRGLGTQISQNFSGVTSNLAANNGN